MMMFKLGSLDMVFGGATWLPLSVVDYNQSGSEPSRASFSDADLKAFALAAIHVQHISEFYAERLQEAKTPKEQQEMKRAATSEMVKAVETEGISVDKYEEIASQAEADQDVAERLKQHIEKIH
jgi:hypothetical protein